MKKIYFMAIVAALAMFGGCSTTVDGEGDVNIAKSELSIGLPIGINRTAIDEEGRASWVEGDTFALWAENRTGAHVLNGVNFRMMYYWHSLQSAVFTSNASPISEGTYTYYAVSPMPQTFIDEKANFTLPAEQQGSSFNGAYDIMVAKPLEAEAIVAGKVNNLALDFQHKMHVLKVKIAENNLNCKVKKLLFTFPTEATGNVSVDITDPDAAPALENGSQNLTINCGDGISTGETAWGVIFPQTISGEIKVTAIGTDDSKSQEKTISISKEFAEGHITPLELTIPRTLPTLRFTIGANNLGEAIEKLTITDHNGNSISVAANNENEYDFVVTEEYGFDDTIFDHYEGKTFTATFESKSAIVSTNFVMPTELTAGVNIIPALTVPYLFEEDFSCIHTAVDSYGDNNANTGGDERKQPGSLLNNYMSHSGWNAARFMLDKGTCPRINARFQQVIIWASQHYGRLDTPAMSNLKDGASVKLQLIFDAGGYDYSGNNQGQNIITINVTTHTISESTAIDGIPVGSSGLGSSYSTTLADFGTVVLTQTIPADCTNNSFAGPLTTYYPSAIISGVTKATRFCFYPTTSLNASTIGNIEFAFYIDNIKVQIVQ